MTSSQFAWGSQVWSWVVWEEVRHKCWVWLPLAIVVVQHRNELFMLLRCKLYQIVDSLGVTELLDRDGCLKSASLYFHLLWLGVYHRRLFQVVVGESSRTSRPLSPYYGSDKRTLRQVSVLSGGWYCWAKIQQYSSNPVSEVILPSPATENKFWEMRSEYEVHSDVGIRTRDQIWLL